MSHVMVRHESGKDMTAREDSQTDSPAFFALANGNKKDERNDREEKTWTGKKIENSSIM
jgi:hypothetical protein